MAALCPCDGNTGCVSGVAADKFGEISRVLVTKVLGCQAQAFGFYLQEM